MKKNLLKVSQNIFSQENYLCEFATTFLEAAVKIEHFEF